MLESAHGTINQRLDQQTTAEVLESWLGSSAGRGSVYLISPPIFSCLIFPEVDRVLTACAENTPRNFGIERTWHPKVIADTVVLSGRAPRKAWPSSQGAEPEVGELPGGLPWESQLPTLLPDGF